VERSGRLRHVVGYIRPGRAIVWTVCAIAFAPRTATPALAAFQFPLTPDWQSSTLTDVSTGGALRDLNHDGFPDLIVANGNDMARQPVVVYLNQGGSFPLTPTWTSSDIDYCGHLDLADVDGDGNLDCAVAVYLGAAGFGNPGKVKLYHGNGDGTFSTTPVWTSAEPFYCFSVAFGDIDMDGRPDLACAAGESYNYHKERFRVFRNVGGTLSTTPYWQCDLPQYALDVAWGDINGDGILDLAFACESHPTTSDPVLFPSKVYFGDGTTLATTPRWQSQDGHDYSNTVALGDVNGDGWLDLALADNNQLHSGADYGRFKIFLNDGSGNLAPVPNWTSSWGGYGSHVSLTDPDGDGDLDLTTGAWWGPVRIYENLGGVFAGTPVWQSNTGSVIENIMWEDVDNDALENGLVRTFVGDGVRRLFDLERRPVRISAVSVGGAPLGPTQYFVRDEQGWLTIGSAPAVGTAVEIAYAASGDLDFAVSNWDDNLGNYLFRNRLNPVGIEAPMPGSGFALTLTPNPARSDCRITLTGGTPFTHVVEIFSTQGARVWTSPAPSGGAPVSIVWDGRDDSGYRVAAGSYWVRVRQGNRVTGGRLVLIR
jgi:hypothetical protein